jgi:hypothetical protein
MAGSPERLAAMQAGRHGAAAASFARCVQHLRWQPAESSTLLLEMPSGLSHELLLEGACVYAVAKREMLRTWVDIQPTLGRLLWAAADAVHHTADVMTAMLSKTAHHAAAAASRQAQQLMALLRQASPSHAVRLEKAGQQLRSCSDFGQRALSAWLAATSRASLESEPVRLYHGWLQHWPHQHLDKLTRAASCAPPAWIQDKANGIILRTAALSMQLLELVQPHTAALTDLMEHSLVALQDKAHGLAMLLQECELGAMAAEERAALVRVGKKPAPEADTLWIGSLSRAASAVGGWLTSMISRRAAPAHDVSPDRGGDGSSLTDNGSSASGPSDHPLVMGRDTLLVPGTEGLSGTFMLPSGPEAVLDDSIGVDAPMESEPEALLPIDPESGAGLHFAEGTANESDHAMPEGAKQLDSHAGALPLADAGTECTSCSSIHSQQEDTPGQQQAGDASTADVPDLSAEASTAEHIPGKTPAVRLYSTAAHDAAEGGRQESLQTISNESVGEVLGNGSTEQMQSEGLDETDTPVGSVQGTVCGVDAACELSSPSQAVSPTPTASPEVTFYIHSL